MIKILFVIHDLGGGGAEKVLVTLVNNLDKSKYDVSVISLFGGGINEQYLSDRVHYRFIFRKMFPGNRHVLKLFTPVLLHKLFIKEKYDIEVSFLEGPSARIISGCPNETTKLVSWIHVQQQTLKALASSFRSEAEAKRCYDRFDRIVCVSDYVKSDFTGILNYQKPANVLYNPVDSEMIRMAAQEQVEDIKNDDCINLIAIGTLKASKGYMRLLRILNRLKDAYRLHLYILGEGPLREEMLEYIAANNLNETVSLLGYQTNPYKYLSNCDLLVCASFAEGFSTAVTEALILGIPVCTVDVSGMKELLGDNNEYGIVSANDEEELYNAMRHLVADPELISFYRNQAQIRGQSFVLSETMKSIDSFLDSLINKS